MTFPDELCFYLLLCDKFRVRAGKDDGLPAMRGVRSPAAAPGSVHDRHKDLLPQALEGSSLRVHEHEAKRLLTAAGLATPAGRIASSADEAAAAFLEFGGAVVKPLGPKRRGKAGQIFQVSSPAEARAAAAFLLGVVPSVLVEEHVDIARELYLAITIDSRAKRPVLLVGGAGGIDVEEATRQGGQLVRLLVSAASGPAAGEVAAAAREAGIEAPMADGFARAALQIWKVFRSCDADLLEVNPLAIDTGGRFVAVDALLMVSDDALPRQPALAVLATENVNELEKAAKAAGWSYIDLEGDIGILSSGAGLTMAILDELEAAGGKAANFLDTAQMDGDGIYRAFELLERNPRAKVILVNIFAGLNRCDSLAEGIVRYIRERKPSRPIVVRMIGNRDVEGHAILRGVGIEAIKELEAAVERAVAVRTASAEPSQPARR